MSDDLPTPAVDWVRSAVPSAREVRVLGRFPGATTSTLHEIEVDRTDAPPLRLVLRRYTDERVRAEEPQYPRTEAGALRILAGASDVVAPRLVAFDEHGTECDVPAVLMTRLAGRPTISPMDVRVWVAGLARALAGVQRLDGAAFEGEYGRWHDPRTAQPPAWSGCPQAWEQLIEASRTLKPAGAETLLHRDYHPGNVLWEDGAVSGIVDWPNACRGVHTVGACDVSATMPYVQRRDANRMRCVTRSRCSTARAIASRSRRPTTRTAGPT
jgi:aminoglycoside phosphotransferase (APT) family kinase protein